MIGLKIIITIKAKDMRELEFKDVQYILKSVEGIEIEKNNEIKMRITLIVYLRVLNIIQFIKKG